ncbi:sigma-70 family RNA polymerase sigma factor [Georgenia sp. EYE_87]|uniref:RNA polymerase sigma factor n=1 Tax=Georgenia sp. EYE_87 TaxID=2853448 RepID=UPI0020039D71|nr:sigma-70 family RNA polymerase sigma factor [Georgenia sp. EYE_87]MCK6209534.1 sigma-70 family RNA polymerase sigma factor [Georgenia sp. EYE_87]
MVKPFEHVVRDHGAAVLRVCRALAGPVDADDVWSETFLAALRAYPRLDADANVEAWLVTIARRKAVDLHRARTRLAVPVADVPATAASVAATAGSVPGPEPHDDLWEAMRALTERQREAIAFHHLAGMPYAEVAAVVGGTEPAARRAAADGIKHLRKTLEARR